MTGVNLALAVALLVANGFFVAVEFALIASRRSQLEEAAEAGRSSARVALSALRNVDLQLAGAQLGITMASLLLGFVAEPAVAGLIEDAISGFVDLPDSVLHTLGFVVALAIVVFLHMVIGEMVPKNIAIAAPERTLLTLAHLNRAYVWLFSPVIRLLNGIANLGVRAFGVEPVHELSNAASAEELAAILAESREEGLIEDVAHQLLSGALDLGDRTVATVVVPESEVVRLPRTASTADAERLVVESGHSRLLVTSSGPQDVLGFIHAKDLLTVPEASRERPIPLSRVRRMLVLPGTTSLDDALLAMQRARIHLALVTGPSGALGIATLEDVIEALVGDIRDESDR